MTKSLRSPHLTEPQRGFVRDWWHAMHGKASPIDLQGFGRELGTHLARCSTFGEAVNDASPPVLADGLLNLGACSAGALPSMREACWYCAFVGGVIVLATEDTNDGESLAYCVRGKLRTKRFRDLIASREPADLYVKCRQAVIVAGRRIDVATLADDLLQLLNRCECQNGTERIVLSYSPFPVRHRWIIDYNRTEEGVAL